MFINIKIKKLIIAATDVQYAFKLLVVRDAKERKLFG